MKKVAAKKPAAKKPAAKKAAAKKPRASSRAKGRPGARPDFGMSVDGFFSRQPGHLRPVVEALRGLIEEAAPDARSSIKWGMPFYEIQGGGMMCAIGAHREHVNLILSGPPDAFEDPEGRLAGEGKTGRHLKLRSLEDLPAPAVRRWLGVAAQLARRPKGG